MRGKRTVAHTTRTRKGKPPSKSHKSHKPPKSLPPVARRIDTAPLLPDVKEEFEALAGTVCTHVLIQARATALLLQDQQALKEAIAARWADRPAHDIEHAQTSLCIQAYAAGRRWAQATDVPPGP